MKNKIEKIHNIFIKRMLCSLIAQLFIFGFLIIGIKNYIDHSQTDMISSDLLIKDRYLLDKLSKYEILGSKYALDLELHNLGDIRNLDSIKFIPITNKKIKLENCDILDSKKFKLCNPVKGRYIGVSVISFDNKILGYIISSKKYAITFPTPVKYDLFLILTSVIGIFILNFGFLFLPLKKKIEENTKHLLSFISLQDISNQELSQITIEEYKAIALTFIDDRKEMLKLQQEKLYYLARKNIAEQVAHDIRSPLTAINIAISDISSISENRRVMIKNASKRINDIASNLLFQYANGDRNQRNNQVDIISSEMIYLVLENIVLEKNYEYRGKQFKILLDCPEDAYSCFVKIELAVFKRILSNLINNSIEATNLNGVLKINILVSDPFIEITLTDNGRGIPKNILPKITNEGFSFGKKSGAGLGLFQAKQHIENSSGTLTISSVVGIGTTVNIKLLRADSPKWFCEKLYIKYDSRIIILDDDPSIHESWVENFSRFPDLKIAHFSAAGDFIAQHDLMADLYLVDYELLTETKNGLDVIEELNLNRYAFLVTNCFEDVIVRNRCESLGVKIIPKPYVQFIPIIASSDIVNSDSFVFIDDDELMRMTWVFAAELASKKIDVFAHPNEFIKSIGKYNKDTIIYIDSELGDDLSGEVYAKQLYNKGFRQIHLATGHSPNKFGHIPWLKSVVNKTPPF